MLLHVDLSTWLLELPNGMISGFKVEFSKMEG